MLALGIATAPSAALAADAIGLADLQRAVERTVATGTVELSATVTVEASAADEGEVTVIEAHGQTTFGSDHRAWLEGTMLEVGDFSFIIDGPVMYLQTTILDEVTEPGQYLLVDVSSPPPGLEDLHERFDVGNDAALALYWLLGVDGAIETVGTDTVGGAKVVRVDVSLDLQRARAGVPAWLMPIYERNLDGLRASGVDVRRAEAWIDDDGLIRRIVYDMPLAVGEGPTLLQVAFGFSGFGRPIDLPLPAPSEIVEAESLFGP